MLNMEEFWDCCSKEKAALSIQVLLDLFGFSKVGGNVPATRVDPILALELKLLPPYSTTNSGAPYDASLVAAHRTHRRSASNRIS